MSGRQTTRTRPDGASRPAFYAPGGGTGGWRDWWSLLHPPYTAWHLGYVAIGAALAQPLNMGRLGWSLLGFFLGLGVGAHALDELRGRPLRTRISTPSLVTTAAAGLLLAAVIGWVVGGARLLPFIAVGAFLAVAYNLEWLGGIVHNTVGFALAWGAFPLLTGYYVQTWRLSAAAVLAAAGAFALSAAQRELSTPARWLRRSVVSARLTATMPDGAARELSSSELLRPLERALLATAAAVVALAVAMVLAAS